MHKKTIFSGILTFLFLFGAEVACCQANADTCRWASIAIYGNKRTKERVILRELELPQGDYFFASQLDQLQQGFYFRLMNTGLFSRVRVELCESNEVENAYDLELHLTEALYIFPIPVVELADRNFNVWWTEQNRSLDRINLGIHFFYVNFLGFNDMLKLVAQYGYTQKGEIDYYFPGIGKDHTHGINLNALWARNREIPYATENNILQFQRANNEFLLNRSRLRLGYSARPDLYRRHRWQIAYNSRTISPSALQLNPDFFAFGETRQQSISIEYDLLYNSLDIVPYPLEGDLVSLSIRKEGLGIFDDISLLTFRGKWQHYLKMSDRWSLRSGLNGKFEALRSKVPYFNYKSLGYQDNYLKGYEFYVIDGLDHLLWSTSLRFNLFDDHIPLGKWMPIQMLRSMGLKTYLSLNSDLGYVNAPYFTENNNLANQWLWGGGIGLDFVFFYNKLIQIEYSLNQLGERGLFLHYRFTFR